MSAMEEERTEATSEAARLAVVRQYPAVEGVADPALSEACRLATLLCHRPMAAVELVMEEWVVVVAAAGLKVGLIPRRESLSPDLLKAHRVEVVGDARKDPRWAHHRLVTDPHGVRFYAAVPLRAPEGVVLGVLSVWDRSPGDLTPSQAESLEALGQMVMGQLNWDRRQRDLERLEAEHARVEKALREAEASYRSLIENTVVGIYRTSPDGRYLSANPMLARIYGFENPAELMASVGDIEEQLYVEPGTRDRFVSELQRADTLNNFEAQIRRKDGEIIWIAETARAVRDGDGQLLFYEGTVQDITARKAAEEQLRHSEILYHSLVEELPQNIFRKDRRERFIFANGRFSETVERPINEILGRTDFDLFPAELARKYQADDQRVMDGGRSVRETERNVTPDGQVHWVEVIKTPLRDETGQITGIQGIFWDVTERQALQDALAYERDLLQALLDHSPDMIYFKDTQSRFVKAGRALAQRFRVPDPESLVGKTLVDLLETESAQALMAEEQELLKRGEAKINEVEEVVDHEGRRTWASVTKVPIYNRAGEPLGLVGVARDITRLMETEQALREAEEKFRAIFENSVEGIFQTSLDGRFLRVNPALARIYGFESPEELMAARTDVRTQVYVEKDRREVFVGRVLAEGSITGFESEVYRRDGSTTWVSESARVVYDREGRPAYFEGTVEDISARKQIETEREKARQSAIEAVRLKSEFVATVSHEIRTPLNAIVPNAERLLETRLDRQQRYLAEGIDHGARMLLQIVNDILEFSKIEAGAVRLEALEFDVEEVLERTVSFFASRAQEKRLELVGDLDPAVPSRVRGDPSRLGQVLNNLVGNAIKFTEAGEVVVEVGLAEWTVPDEVHLWFRVRDTGIGIAPEARSRVFQAFAQADGSMSRRYGGTGLGLAITRRFVELMGGQIDFESVPGQGTTFFFNVRLGAVAGVPVRAGGESLVGMRVLLVEDNGAQRRVVARALAGEGAAVVVGAEGVSDAIVHLQSALRQGQPFELVFFDAELPGNDLMPLARRLRAAGGNGVVLIALASPGTLGDEHGLNAAGIRGSLVKPVCRRRLGVEVKALLAPSRAVEVASVVSPAPAPGSGSAVGLGLRVLVVEDHPLNQRVAREMLTRLGAVVDTAFSGPEAIEAFRRERYDLILMDCQMPGMDGYETTQRMRELEACCEGCPGVKRVPIVALSANALAGDRERGLAAGMDDYLTKPFRQADLIRVLQGFGQALESPANEVVEKPMDRSVAVESVDQGVRAGDEVPILDVGPLQALADPDDPGVLQGFVGEFLSETPGRLTRMAGMLGSEEWVALRAEAHRLKGSASYMGARRLVQACAVVEDASTEVQGLAEALGRVEQEFDVVRVALQAHLATTGAGV